MGMFFCHSRQLDSPFTLWYQYLKRYFERIRIRILGLEGWKRIGNNVILKDASALWSINVVDALKPHHWSHVVCVWMQGECSQTQSQQQCVLLYLNPKAVVASASQSFPRVEFEANPTFWFEPVSESWEAFRDQAPPHVRAGEKSYWHTELLFFCCQQNPSPWKLSSYMLAVQSIELVLPSPIALLADAAIFQANFLSYLVTQMKVLSYCD